MSFPPPKTTTLPSARSGISWLYRHDVPHVHTPVRWNCPQSHRSRVASALGGMGTGTSVPRGEDAASDRLLDIDPTGKNGEREEEEEEEEGEEGEDEGEEGREEEKERKILQR